jgi:hypothetical protein
MTTITRLRAGEKPKEYDMANPVEAEAAEREFSELIADEWQAYDSTGEPVDSLQTEGETLMRPRINGG